jgi:hypothetical protein
LSRHLRERCGARQLVVALAGLVVALVAASCTSSEDASAPTTFESVTATVPPVAVSPDVATAVTDAAASGVNRWPNDEVTVSVDGTPTERDLQVLDAALAEQGRLAGLTLRRVAADGMIQVRFAPKDQWRNQPGPDTPIVPGVELAGLTRLAWEQDGTVTSATVDIDAAIAQSQRNHTIVHELLHALGLDHVSCASSVLNGTADAAPTWTLSELDSAMLRAWYAPGLPSGTAADEVDEHLATSAAGPTCQPQQVDARLGAEGTLWCERVLAGPSPCMLVDGLGDPPTPPFVATRWLLDDVLYDHDPTRYEVVSVEGRRALCELGGTGRRPCQYTDGPGPLTGTDLWTDGQFVYDSPT